MGEEGAAKGAGEDISGRAGGGGGAGDDGALEVENRTTSREVAHTLKVLGWRGSHHWPSQVDLKASEEQVKSRI